MSIVKIAVHHWSFVRRWPIPGLVTYGLYVDQGHKDKRISRRWRDLVDLSNEVGHVALQFEDRVTLGANGYFPLLLPLHGKMIIHEQTATLKFEFGVPVLPLILKERRGRGAWYVAAELT